MIRLAWLLVAACAADDGGPRLESVMPTAAGRNTMVTLTGTRLCIAASTDLCSPLTVALGLDPPMIDAPVMSLSATTATFTVPDAVPIGATDIIVTADGRSSNALAFEVTP